MFGALLDDKSNKIHRIVDLFYLFETRSQHVAFKLESLLLQSPSARIYRYMFHVQLKIMFLCIWCM